MTYEWYQTMWNQLDIVQTEEKQKHAVFDEAKSEYEKPLSEMYEASKNFNDGKLSIIKEF